MKNHAGNVIFHKIRRPERAFPYYEDFIRIQKWIETCKKVLKINLEDLYRIKRKFSPRIFKVFLSRPKDLPLAAVLMFSNVPLKRLSKDAQPGTLGSRN